MVKQNSKTSAQTQLQGADRENIPTVCHITQKTGMKYKRIECRASMRPIIGRDNTIGIWPAVYLFVYQLTNSTTGD